MNRCPPDFIYSDKYADNTHEYRHVHMPLAATNHMLELTGGGKRLLEDAEWRSLGVTQSRGWEHYASYRPEPHILLFRRKLETDIWLLMCSVFLGHLF